MNIKLFLLACLSCVLIVGCSDDETNPQPSGGGTPSINSASMPSASIGQQNGEMTIAGSNLGGVVSVQLGDGITTTGFESRSASELLVRFNVAGNAAPGPRTITVNTSGGTASSGSLFSVINNHVPKASYSINPPSGSINTIFEFDASNSTDQDGNIASYSWTFGDGATTKGKKVTHKFTTLGDFTVKLVVADSRQGTGSASRKIEIGKNAAPVARFTVTPGNEGSTGTTFQFDASRSSDPDGKIKEYIWDFQDGSSKARGVVVQHQFKKEGEFIVELTVQDNTGGEGFATQRIKIQKSSETVCTKPAPNRGLIFGNVVGVEPGNNAIVRFSSSATCANTYYHCGDMRKAQPENFYGVIQKMTFLGNGTFRIYNCYPYRWPPPIGEKVFLIYKTCSQNPCPPRR